MPADIEAVTAIGSRARPICLAGAEPVASRAPRRVEEGIEEALVASEILAAAMQADRTVQRVPPARARLAPGRRVSVSERPSPGTAR